MHTEPIMYIKTSLYQVFTDHITIKALGSIAFVVGSFLFAGLSKNAMLSLLVLIILDFIVAVWHAKKIGVLIDSKQVYKTPVKILVYYTMIASGHLVESGLPQQISFVDDTILTFLLITEFLSITRHFSNLGYKTPTKLINNLKMLQEEK